MTSSPAGRLRGLRGSVFGVSTVLLAAAAHVLGGGALPNGITLLVVGIPVACASVVLARRTRGLPALLGVLAATQVLLHQVFMTTASGAACTTAAPASHLGHPSSAAHCGPMTGMAMHAAVPSAWMVAAHTLATIAVAVLLTRGERLIVRVGAWIRSRVHIALPALPARAAAGVRAPLTTIARTGLRAGDVYRRGPPARTTGSPPVTA